MIKKKNKLKEKRTECKENSWQFSGWKGRERKDSELHKTGFKASRKPTSSRNNKNLLQYSKFSKKGFSNVDDFCRLWKAHVKPRQSSFLSSYFPLISMYDFVSFFSFWRENLKKKKKIPLIRILSRDSVLSFKTTFFWSGKKFPSPPPPAEWKSCRNVCWRHLVTHTHPSGRIFRRVYHANNRLENSNRN